MDQPRLVISSTRYEFPNGHFSNADYKSSILDCGNILRCPMQNSHKKIDELRKENFNLKLRLFLLEDSRRTEAKSRSVHEYDQLTKDSIYYKLQTEKLTREVEEKRSVLRDAFHLIEHLEKMHWETEKRNHETVTSLRDELQYTKLQAIELRQKLKDKNKGFKNAQLTIDKLKKTLKKYQKKANRILKPQALKLPSKKSTKIYAHNRRILKVNVNSMDLPNDSSTPPPPPPPPLATSTSTTTTTTTKSIEIQCPSVMDLILHWMVQDGLKEHELKSATINAKTKSKSKSKSTINIQENTLIAACQTCDLDVMATLPSFMNHQTTDQDLQPSIIVSHIENSDSNGDNSISITPTLSNGTIQNVELSDERTSSTVTLSHPTPRQSSELIPNPAKPEAKSPLRSLFLPLGCVFQ